MAENRTVCDGVRADIRAYLAAREPALREERRRPILRWAHPMVAEVDEYLCDEGFDDTEIDVTIRQFVRERLFAERFLERAERALDPDDELRKLLRELELLPEPRPEPPPEAEEPDPVEQLTGVYRLAYLVAYEPARCTSSDVATIRKQVAAETSKRVTTEAVQQRLNARHAVLVAREASVGPSLELRERLLEAARERLDWCRDGGVWDELASAPPPVFGLLIRRRADVDRLSQSELARAISYYQAKVEQLEVALREAVAAAQPSARQNRTTDTAEVAAILYGRSDKTVVARVAQQISRAKATLAGKVRR